MKRLLRALSLAEWGGDELLIAIIAFGATAYALALWVDWRLAFVPLLPLAIVVWFFRDPNRRVEAPPEVMLSPADGRVTDIEEVDEAEFIQGKALRIGIFLSPFDVHVNRAPCAGMVRLVSRRAGEFLPAYNPEAPRRNESVTLGLETPAGLRVLVKQISGVLARRIVCDTEAGEALALGQPYGMIKFGSRTELYVPAGAAVLVQVGSKVKGGQSQLCRTVSLSSRQGASGNGQ